jgi:hypothetical protein
MSSNQSQSYFMTDGQSASLFWCQATISDPQPIFLSLHGKIFRHLQLILVWGVPSDEGTGL